MQGFSRKLLNDRHEYLIAMLQGVQQGYNLPEHITLEQYRYIRENKDADPVLAGFVGLFESQERFEMFRENEFEIMYFNRRVAYFQSYQDPKPSLNPPFSSVYVCHKMLPEKMVFEEIEKR